MKKSKRQTQRPVATGRPAARAPEYQEFEMTVSAQPRAGWPSISVCMIVKNESSHLRGCLESLGDLASQLVIVDTGSTDDTVDIARSFGAEVHFFAWINDFAAARNESLRYATCDWIFWLDADDRLSPQAVAQLKNAAASGRAEAYSCRVQSQVMDGNADVTEHERLFLNHKGIRFEGAVHETVFPWLVHLKQTHAITDIVVQHTGYHISFDEMKRKYARNLVILERQIEQQPENIHLLYHRGQTRVAMGQIDAGVSDLRAYLAGTSGAHSRFDYKRFYAYATISSIHDRRQEWDRMESVTREALKEFPRHPYLVAVLARLDLDKGQADEALADLLAAYKRNQGVVDGFRPADAWIEAGIARCYRALGQYELAVQWAEKACGHDENPVPSEALLARLYVEAGRVAHAEALLESLLAAAQVPEPWLVLAELRRRQGRYAEACASIEEAGKRGLPQPQVDELLTRVRAGYLLLATKGRQEPASKQQIDGMSFLAQGEHLRAAECFAEAIEAAPTDPNNYRYLAVALEKLGHTQQAHEAWNLARHWQEQAASA